MPDSRGSLRSYFTAVGAKRLSAVEAHSERSNQHEFDGVGALRTVFGDERRRFENVRFLYWSESDEPISADAFLTWYDAREQHPSRSEYRLYFPATTVSDAMQEGDLAVFARDASGEVLVIICQAESTAEIQVRWLFGLGPATRGVEAHEIRFTRSVGFVESRILAEIGVESEPADTLFLDQMLQIWGPGFPTSREFSAYARSTVPNIDPVGDPDETVLRWLDQEELLFRAMEEHIVRDRIEAGFSTVEDFLKFSLSVQNRRKSRAGLAVENHLQAIFDNHRIRYARGAETENRAKPDFLFPGSCEYRDESFPSADLTMLGAKSSLKDRWRQVLSEAARIPRKHLFTLEPGISENQTVEMQAHDLRLVIPDSLRTTFSEAQQDWLFGLGEFLELVMSRQQRHPA